MPDPDTLKYSCFSFLHGRFKTFSQSLHKSIKWKQTTRKHKRFSTNFPTNHKEVSNQFKLVFKLIDANGDGKISPYELSELLSCLGYDKSEAAKEAEGMVREVDCNGDGFIDLDEFIGAVNYDGNGEDYLMDAFLIFDADKNGLISAAELQRVLNNLGFDDCGLQRCREMIQGVDKDGDGFVDFKEFQLMMKGNS